MSSSLPSQSAMPFAEGCGLERGELNRQRGTPRAACGGTPYCILGESNMTNETGKEKGRAATPDESVATDRFYRETRYRVRRGLIPLIGPSDRLDSGLCRLEWPSGVGWTLNDYSE